MKEFQRARSHEQKCQRMADIKDAAKRLFATHPYHEITLTTIADELGFSRANLYKYVSTKEEIFLMLAADERQAYTADLLKALESSGSLSFKEGAAAWAQVAEDHRDYFRYSDMLFSILETNVSVERLMEFKRGYYDDLPALQKCLKKTFGVRKKQASKLVNMICYHGIGLSGSCTYNPLVKEALARLDIERAEVDFYAEMYEFILMCLKRYGKGA